MAVLPLLVLLMLVLHRLLLQSPGTAMQALLQAPWGWWLLLGLGLWLFSGPPQRP